jgi:translation initiation factor 3 subunit G
MPATTTAASTRWGDDDYDEDDRSVEQLTQAPSSSNGLPASSTRVNHKGVKTVTTYKLNTNGQTIKTVTESKIHTYTVREHKRVAERRKWMPFGQAALDEDQSNVTIQSKDDVFLEDPNADVDQQDEDAGKALAGNMNAFWAKQKRRELERKYDVNTGAPVEDDVTGEQEKEEEGGWSKVGSAGGAVGGKYVPPSARGGSSLFPNAGKPGGASLSAMADRLGDGPVRSNDNRDQNTIRVTNISEDTGEEHLQELFSRFGPISRVYLAKDKETMQSRGFAFVSFVQRSDAQRAMDKLQGYGYDHLILKLEWAKPSAPKDPATSGTEYRSGYGKALAQDTKEKVTYASNLTRGVK